MWHRGLGTRCCQKLGEEEGKRERGEEEEREGEEEEGG